MPQPDKGWGVFYWEQKVGAVTGYIHRFHRRNCLVMYLLIAA
ncbi:hypothetical protein CHCC14821_0080 [Bacillus paralicheniformis]|nr:hypothetical protein [Bacillus paralicheniformis]TWM21773.1 hypothetical protein CHCC14821_0080 [Bacillus paralicheniformis]